MRWLGRVGGALGDARSMGGDDVGTQVDDEEAGGVENGEEGGAGALEVVLPWVEG